MNENIDLNAHHYFFEIFSEKEEAFEILNMLKDSISEANFIQVNCLSTFTVSEIAADIHKLAGTFAYLGYDKISKVMYELEHELNTNPQSTPFTKVEDELKGIRSTISRTIADLDSLLNIKK